MLRKPIEYFHLLRVVGVSEGEGTVTEVRIQLTAEGAAQAAIVWNGEHAGRAHDDSGMTKGEKDIHVPRTPSANHVNDTQDND